MRLNRKKSGAMLCRNKIKVYLCTRNQKKRFYGTLTEWLGSGLQNRVQQFESAGYLAKKECPKGIPSFFALPEHVFRVPANLIISPARLSAQNVCRCSVKVFTVTELFFSVLYDSFHFLGEIFCYKVCNTYYKVCNMC